MLSNITYSNGSIKFNSEDGSMSWMTELNATALSLWAGLDYFFFPLLILQLVASYWHDFRYGRYTHRLASSYLEGANFLTAAVSTLLTLWVILFFYFEVLARGTLSGGTDFQDSGLALTGLRSYRFYA